jgi:hypothetical protein
MSEMDQGQVNEIGHNNPSKIKDLDGLVKAARSLGKTKGGGDSALVQLGLNVIEAAGKGILDPNSNPDKKLDQVHQVYEGFVEGYSKKPIKDHVAMPQQVSKLRVLAKMGAMTTCDGGMVANRALEAVAEAVDAVAAGNKSAKTLAAYPALVNVARKQTENGQDVDLTDEQIREAIAKPTPDEKTIEGEVERAHKIIEALITGDKGLKASPDAHPQLFQAEELLRTQLAAYQLAKDKAETLAKMAALGWTVNEETGEVSKAA